MVTETTLVIMDFIANQDKMPLLTDHMSFSCKLNQTLTAINGAILKVEVLISNHCWRDLFATIFPEYFVCVILFNKRACSFHIGDSFISHKYNKKSHSQKDQTSAKEQRKDKPKWNMSE